MALADYFQRSAVATAQILGGFDADKIQALLERTRVGLSLPTTKAGRESTPLLDMSVRLLARFYPELSLHGGDDATRQRVTDLARAINPHIQFDDSRPSTLLAIGEAACDAETIVYVGSDGWDAHVSTERSTPLGDSGNPFGAGTAACLGVANVFRNVLVADDPQLDTDLTLSTLDLTTAESTANATLDGIDIGQSNVLVGLGAIGNACVWALARAPLVGGLHLVDHETIELSNLQRYILTRRRDEGSDKTTVAASAFTDALLRPDPHKATWAQFVERHGHRWNRVLVALDSARHRRAVQATLPRWIANAWTQPGDLGVSTHPFTDGACLACLYLAAGEVPSEDKMIGRALGLEGPERELQLRNLLHSNSAPPEEMLREIAQTLDVPYDALLPFTERPIRDLYVDGVCGGAVLPLGRLGTPDQNVHVPVAHQSALAGVLLAARLAAHALDRTPTSAHVARLDLMHAQAQLFPHLYQPAAKDPRGICICQDPTYVEAYRLKYGGDP